MKQNTYEFPKSSFLGMPKDMSLIISKVLSSQNVLKLIYHNGKDWSKKPAVTSAQIKEMFETKQISNVPRLYIDTEDKTYIRFTYGTTVPNATNPEYRDNTFGIDILCHFDNWDLGDFELRPYRIAGEIDAMLDKQHLTGIGRLEFISCSPAVYNEEFAGVSLTYLAIRGNEDEVNPLE